MEGAWEVTIMSHQPKVPGMYLLSGTMRPQPFATALERRHTQLLEQDSATGLRGAHKENQVPLVPDSPPSPTPHSPAQVCLVWEFLRPVPKAGPLLVAGLSLTPNVLPISTFAAWTETLPLHRGSSASAIPFNQSPHVPPPLLIDPLKSLLRTWPSPGISAPLSPPFWHWRAPFHHLGL